jgi:hypothetical protein
MGCVGDRDCHDVDLIMRGTLGSRVLGIAMLGLSSSAACGEPTDDTSQTEPTSTSTQGESASDTELPPVACNGGPACGAGEFCTTGNEDCDCDGQFQYCDLVRTDPGCYAIPDPCAQLEGDAQLDCIASQACSFLDIDDGWIDGVLHCGRYEECAGDCDFDPDSCIDTSSGPGDSSSGDSTSGDSSSGG